MHIMNRAYLSYIHYMHLNHEYFWRIYELNEYLAKICMHSLLRSLATGAVAGVAGAAAGVAGAAAGAAGAASTVVIEGISGSVFSLILFSALSRSI